MPKLFYKIIGFTLAISILYSPLSFVFKTNNALAVLGVGDVGTVNVNSVTDPATLGFYKTMSGLSVKQLIAVGTTAKSTTGQLTKTMIDFAKKLAGFVLKKLILERLTDAMIDYINRGYKGGIIVDWEQMLEDAKQNAVGMLAQEISVTKFLCEPFNLNVQLALIPRPKWTQEVTCTLDKITGNIQNFLDDFNSGNWIAYQELWYPQNNYFGATLIAWNEAKIRGGKAAEAAKNEGIAGKGFWSKKKCEKDAQGKETCRIITPGEFYAAAGINALITIPTNSIINADEIATYIGAIADAAINQLVKSGIDGIKSLGKTADATSATPANPCAGQTGDAWRACVGLRNLNTASINSSKSYLTAQVYSTLAPRQEAANLLSSAIEAQTTLVDALQALVTCSPTDANKNELSLEQNTLDELQAKYDDNQTFIESLQQTTQQLSDPNADFTTSVTAFANNESLLDSTTAEALLESAKTQFSEIQADVAAKLPSVQAQTTCKTTTP